MSRTYLDKSGESSPVDDSVRSRQLLGIVAQGCTLLREYLALGLADRFGFITSGAYGACLTRWPMDDETSGQSAAYELPADQDWLMTQLVQWAEIGLATGVTLLIRGSVVSGMLISEADYIRSLREGFAEGLRDKGAAEPIDRALASILEAVDAVREDEGPIAYPQYAHLRDAQVFAPGNEPLPSKQAIALRVKLSSIDSFSLGKMANV